MVQPDMFLPKVQIVLFWPATRCGFLNLLKKAKTNSQLVKIWLILWNPHLVALKSTTSGFLAFLSNFWPKIAQKHQKPEVSDYDAISCGISQKSPNLEYLTVSLAFLSNFWQNHIWYSGTLQKCDIFNPWAVHVWSMI